MRSDIIIFKNSQHYNNKTFCFCLSTYANMYHPCIITITTHFMYISYTQLPNRLGSWGLKLVILSFQVYNWILTTILSYFSTNTHNSHTYYYSRSQTFQITVDHKQSSLSDNTLEISNLRAGYINVSKNTSGI